MNYNAVEKQYPPVDMFFPTFMSLFTITLQIEICLPKPGIYNSCKMSHFSCHTDNVINNVLLTKHIQDPYIALQDYIF